ncbi:MAG: 2Fe-2S iron-sulfur cluster-binding protein [Chitinophagales bacterium]|jgi:ring-1,2-phenylacetyl-CoA epoxidase subunit PaaE|nr:2Fe-2S iron-sulfur cluster-binding protein [Chitinophagales bacterium]
MYQKSKLLKKTLLTSNAVDLELSIAHLNFSVFKPGQYLNIKQVVSGRELIRSYSISKFNPDNSVHIGIKAIENGVFSNYALNELQEDMLIDISEPMGTFTLTETSHHIFIAAGSGITPILSMLTHISKNINQSAQLLYINTSPETTMYADEIKELSIKSNISIQYFYSIQAGRITLDFIKNYLKANILTQSQVYVCGPNEIIEFATQANTELNPNKHIIREYFTEKSEDQKVAQTVGNDSDLPLAKGDIAQITLKIDGRKFDLTCGYDQKILDVALDKNIDIPYSCLVAACSTCKAKLTQGSIHMADKDALTQREINAGYVLTCQTYPRSKQIYIDFDA